jgi:uncharacterized membrane protein YkgB
MEEKKLVPLRWRRAFDAADHAITCWMARVGPPFVRIALGVVFFWFGALKLFPGASPAEELVRRTIYLFDPDSFIVVLAVWEMLIGAGLIAGVLMRLTLLLLFLQMAGTVLPLFVLPDAVWERFPFVLTLEGQYIVKNLVILGAAMVVGGTVRGGRLVSEPSTRS